MDGSWWETWGPWVSITALVVGVLAGLQVFGGRPHAWITFVSIPTDRPSLAALGAEIVNKPPNRLMRALGMWRATAERVNIGFAVYEYATDNNLAGGLITPECTEIGVTGKRKPPIDLFPDYPVLVSLILAQAGEGCAFIVIPDIKNKRLDLGTYRCEIFVDIGQRNRTVVRARALSVGPTTIGWGKRMKPTIKPQKIRQAIAHPRPKRSS